MKQNLDIKVSSLFKEKKQKNTTIRIKLDSDSEDNQNDFDKESLKSNDILGNNHNSPQNKKYLPTIGIEVDENKENIKSSSQYSNSTSASQSKNSSNIKNFPACSMNSKKSGSFSKKKDKNKLEKKDEAYDIFNISLRTKKILENINEKYRKAKNQNKISLNSCSNLSEITEGKKLIGRKIKNYELNKELKKNESEKLSEKTQETIQKLKAIRKSKIEDEKNKSSKSKIIRNNSFSNLHIKYDQLLNQSRELRLPIIYKQLFDSFVSLEKTINRNKLLKSNNLNTFNNIRNSIVSSTHKNFNINIFKQILYIVPHFYIFKYINSNKFQETFSLNENLDRNYDLLIDIPNDFSERIKKNYSNDFNFLEINYCSQASDCFTPIMTSLTEKEMNIRKSIFHNILNYIVNDYHSKYLKENKIKIKFNPLTQKTWHHNFDPDKYCKAIPLFDLPSPPEYKCVFVETINKNDIKNQISSIKYDEIKSSTKVSSSSASKFVSEDYIKKIRAKEQALNIVKEINNYNYYYNYKNDKNKMIKNMLLQMKTLLMTHKSSLELNVLSDLIINSDRAFKDFFENTQKLNQVIINFSKNYEGFINISNHSRLGPIVVLINNEYNIPDIFNKIE